jgi:hypothetical protein
MKGLLPGDNGLCAVVPVPSGAGLLFLWRPATLDGRRPRAYHFSNPDVEGLAMTFGEAVAELRAKYPKADLSPSVKHGKAFTRAAHVDFQKDKGVYVGRDADGTEVLVYFNDDARVIACTEIEPDEE